jgi:hypothetical protein
MICLKNICEQENIEFNSRENHIRCVAHIINLAIQDALKMLKTGNINEQDFELNESNAPISDLIPKVSSYSYILKTIIINIILYYLASKIGC